LGDVFTLYERFRLISNPGSQRHPTSLIAHFEERDEAVGASKDGQNTNVSECALSHAMQTFMDQMSRCLEQMSNTLERLSISSPSVLSQDILFTAPPAGNKTNTPTKPCPRCGRVGHWRRHCRHHNGASRSVNRAKCFEYNQPDHRRQNCATLQQTADGVGAICSDTSEPMNVPVRAPKRENLVYVRARINMK